MSDFTPHADIPAFRHFKKEVLMSCRALIVGVNTYKLPGSNLQGCVNDATNVRDILLKYYSFSVSGIRVLTDDRATKKAMMDRLNWLVKDAKA